MFGWSPDAWNGIGVVGIVCLVGVGFWLALMRGWLVLGMHHREVVDQLRLALDTNTAARSEDQRAIAAFAEAAMKQNVTGEVNAHLMEAVRQLAEGGKS